MNTTPDETSVAPTAPHSPLPGPVESGPDLAALRLRFDDKLAQSAANDPTEPVSDEHVAALDAAHDLLADALSSVDSTR